MNRPNPTKICIVCNKEYKVSRRKREDIRRFCSHACRGKYFSGSMNGNWKGSDALNRDHCDRQSVIMSSEYRVWRKLVVDKDGWKCVLCGKKTSLVAHHIQCYWEYPELRFDLDNGITLCRSCHTNVHLNKVITIEPSETNTLDIVNSMKIESELVGDHKRQSCEAMSL